jgi:hypothetical protein
MPNVIQYTCRHELWPVLVAVLASSGYHIDIPIQRSGSGASAMVIRDGAVSLLFTQLPASDMVEIEVWGAARDAVIQLFESLPLPLTKPLGEALLERTV